ncbi:hypothetical protein BZG34_07355 [Neisseria gonorrhoeae]|nr:hypothetical protein BZG33_01385 [Neisseria gonorrhoeae]ASQ73838.1 hypothetical protein BZG34_07355 [Neisseria gonorrhoeae]
MPFLCKRETGFCVSTVLDKSSHLKVCHSHGSGNPIRSVLVVFKFQATSKPSFPRKWESGNERQQEFIVND